MRASTHRCAKRVYFAKYQQETVVSTGTSKENTSGHAKKKRSPKYGDTISGMKTLQNNMTKCAAPNDFAQLLGHVLMRRDHYCTSGLHGREM